jgi:rhodanese-related sulfurtransferase
MGEFRRGGITGAIHIPMAEVGRRLAELPTDRPLVVYCATGLRSAMVVRMLMRQGRKEVYNLTGGIVAWQRGGKG